MNSHLISQYSSWSWIHMWYYMTYEFVYEFQYMKNIVKSYMQWGGTKVPDVLLLVLRVRFRLQFLGVLFFAEIMWDRDKIASDNYDNYAQCVSLAMPMPLSTTCWAPVQSSSVPSQCHWKLVSTSRYQDTMRSVSSFTFSKNYSRKNAFWQFSVQI